MEYHLAKHHSKPIIFVSLMSQMFLCISKSWYYININEVAVITVARIMKGQQVVMMYTPSTALFEVMCVWASKFPRNFISGSRYSCASNSV